MANLLAASNTAQNSADVPLTDGQGATFNLMGAAALDAASIAYIQIKASDGNYFTVATLNPTNPAATVTGPGTFRARTLGNIAQAYGVDKT